jgi:CRISPR system Cascade subunit CasD
MAEHLIIRLAGAMASWGDIAVGEVRPSATRPGRSGIIGLLAACLGIERGDEQRLRALDHLAIAIRQDDTENAGGLALHDYHTAQVPRAERKVRYRTRRDELTWLQRHDLGTILSSRAYRQDAHSVIVAIYRPVTAPSECPALQQMAEACERPAFTPYLGRRSCPLALPLRPRLCEAPDFDQACRQAFTDADEESRLFSDLRCLPDLSAGCIWFWDDAMQAAGLAPCKPDLSERRNDQSCSHTHRQFEARNEHRAAIAPKAASCT